MGFGFSFAQYFGEKWGLDVGFDVFFPQKLTLTTTEGTVSVGRDVYDSLWGIMFDLGPTFAVIRNDKMLFALNPGYMNSDAETKSQSLNLTRTILKSLIKDVSYTDDFDEENFISAVLTLKFKQKEINKRETLNAAVRLVHDDDIIVTGKNGKRISGSNFFISVTRDIEKLASGRFNEKQIETEMRTILREVNDGKVVS